jgi:hypothetical protein
MGFGIKRERGKTGTRKGNRNGHKTIVQNIGCGQDWGIDRRGIGIGIGRSRTEGGKLLVVGKLSKIKK